jgi:hypothetical protein
MLAAVVSAAAASQGGNYALRQSVVVSAGGVVAAGCYTVVATIGQPVAGTVGDGKKTRLISGFAASVGPTGDALFRSGFDVTTGDCTP